MNTNVVTTTPDASVAAASAAMVAASVGSAVVMQGSFLAGILTERDVLRAAASGEDLGNSAVVGVDDSRPAGGRSGRLG